jgi:tripartite-type tricarboxylate transporter receptor subunit TctC
MAPRFTCTCTHKQGKFMHKPIIALLLICGVPLAHAQGLGNIGGRPVRIIVPVAPGGPSDSAVRILVPRLSEALRQTLVVDNRPSNNGIAGTEIAARANPDGLTLNIGNSGTHAINPSLYKSLPYDPVRDFTPIIQIVTSGMVLVATPKLPVNSYKDFVALAKKDPGKLNMAVAGATGELAGEALMAMSGFRMNNVRYKGSSPAEIGTLSGESDASLLTPLASMQHIASGRLKALGISSAKRSPLLPNVPTLAEAGVAGYDFQIWHGLFAPLKTPTSVTQNVHKAAMQALSAPEVKERFNNLGFTIIGNTSQEFAAVVQSELAKFRKVVMDAGIKVE